jgi:hypothetical protein
LLISLQANFTRTFWMHVSVIYLKPTNINRTRFDNAVANSQLEIVPWLLPSGVLIYQTYFSQLERTKTAIAAYYRRLTNGLPVLFLSIIIVKFISAWDWYVTWEVNIDVFTFFGKPPVSHIRVSIKTVNTHAVKNVKATKTKLITYLLLEI